MANITPQQIVFPPGLEVITASHFVAVTAGGDVVLNNDGNAMFIVIRNAHATLPRTVTIDDSVSVGPAGAQAFDADVDVVVTALRERWIGKLSPQRFTASVALTYSDAGADLLIGAFYL